MAIVLIVNGTSYEYPIPGSDPNWGEGATDWAEAVTEALNTLLAPGDILQTIFSIDNNISVATNINGLLFDPGTVRAANVDYAIYRTSTLNPSGNAETGTIHLIYDDSAAVNQKWKLTQSTDGSSGISLSITDSGQMQYISSDIDVAGYSGEIRFKARTLSK
jgi:hypothetical protein